MWPRDGALVAYALDLAGYSEVTRRFFDFCAKIIEKDGYFLHKFNPSGNLASSWHPWMKDDALQLPIQEDETALVVWALWKHYETFRDIEFIKPLYKPLIKNAGNMMLNYRDAKTRLPLPSYDLWEERQGILTFTASTVYGGLAAAASFARAFGEEALAVDYDEGAREVREAMDKYLYLDKEKRFARMISLKDGKPADVDKTVDASFFGIFAFGAYPVGDERVRSTMEQVYDKLWCKTDVGCIARYEGDIYHRVSNDVPGNPWFVTTLWLAEYYVALAESAGDLEKVLEIMHWVADRALPSGVLAEQINPFTNAPLSVSPLTWSHATFCIVAHKYMNKLIELEKCGACGRSKYSKKRGTAPCQ
jgi:GH15 family glucan-1,4-alpha-glucosidase